MKRSMCGLIILAAVAGLGSCGGDPTGDELEQGKRVLADPSAVFVSDGASKFVVAQLVDTLGNQLPVDFVPQNVGPGITVEKDTTFLSTTIGTHLETSQRFIVTGTAPNATQFELTSGGVSTTIPVKVTPTSTTATVSNPAPAANEGVIVTLPAGYKFGSGAGANIEGAAGFVSAVAPDSSSITVLLPPGSTGTLTVDSVGVDFAPGVLFSLPTDQTVTVGPVTPQAGTGATGTAPAVTIPPPGGTTFFYDGGTYDYSAPLVVPNVGTFPIPSRLYKIVVADTTTLTTTLDWTSPEDLGLYFYQSNGTTAFGTAPADAGGPGVHPESTDNTFPPGTYYMAVLNFSDPVTNPPWIALTITNSTE
jgi:hypothetical protein